MSNFKWWEHGNFPNLGSVSFEVYEIAEQSLGVEALRGGPSVITKEGKGILDCTVAEFETAVEELGARRIASTDSKTKYYFSQFAWDTGAIAITCDNPEERGVVVRFLTTDRELHGKISVLLDKIKPRVSSGKVYSIKSTSDGLDLVSLGKASFPIERGNYEDVVLKNLDHVISEFATIDPCGRLVVINGQPGTGKTYLMRGLLDSVPNALFITVPPSLVARFANPDFIPTLMDIRRGDRKASGPIIVLVEDADEILVPRHETSMDNISACLNLSDGLMGHLFDLRIVATTNAMKANMDAAILRPGRLCRRIDVGPLTFGRAWDVYNRLTGKELEGVKKEDKGLNLTKKLSLAEVYVLARDNGWTPTKVDGKLGFVADSMAVPYPGY